MKHFFISLIIIACFVSRPVKAFEVMSWVSPWNIPDSKTVLASSYGGVTVGSTLSRLGLQFWDLYSNGNVSLATSSSNVQAADVTWFANWGKQNNVKIFLCVVNDGSIEHSYNGFDWTLVRSACYGNTADITIRNLLKEVDKYDLAGIDLDFEGEDAQGGPFTNADNINYAIFVNKLADSLHARGKLCTVDTYPAEGYGAPKPSWWGSWKTKIDAIHTMGYTSSYWSCPTAFSYQGQQDFAIKEGVDPQKVLLGMPMWVDNWAGGDNNTGTSNVDNLNYILNCLQYQTGITLWDIHYPVAFIDGTTIHPWTADTVWHLMKAIHDGQAPNAKKCTVINPSGKVIDDMSNHGINLKGGEWSAFSDYWSRTTANQVNSTKVLIPDLSYDMALGTSNYGDITKGYLDVPGKGSYIESTIKTLALSGTDPANGGFIMNFLPVNPSLDTTAQLWDAGKIGVERDLSAYKTLVVGAQCTAGKSIRIYLRTKAELAAYDAPYLETFTCSGNYEDFVLTFANLKPLWGNGPTGFDAVHSLQLTIDYVDPNPPSSINLNIAGVAVDTSVIALHNSATSIQNVMPQTNALKYFADKNGIHFSDAMQTEVRLMSMDGKVLCDKTFNSNDESWGMSLSDGIYLLQIIRDRQITNAKIKLIR